MYTEWFTWKIHSFSIFNILSLSSSFPPFNSTPRATHSENLTSYALLSPVLLHVISIFSSLYTSHILTYYLFRSSFSRHHQLFLTSHFLCPDNALFNHYELVCFVIPILFLFIPFFLVSVLSLLTSWPFVTLPFSLILSFIPPKPL